MANGSDIPTFDPVLLAWALNYSGVITSAPTAVGLVAGDATALAALVSDFEARLTTATEPATRTKLAVTAKNVAKKALVAKCRQLARIIKAFPAITSVQLQNLGLHVRDIEPTPVPAPATRPMITVDPAGRLRLVDESTPEKKTKPVGVIGAVLFTKIDGAAPQTLGEAAFAGLATRSRYALTIPPGNFGKKLWVMAQWINGRGQGGPISEIVSTTIAA